MAEKENAQTEQTDEQQTEQLSESIEQQTVEPRVQKDYAVDVDVENTNLTDPKTNAGKKAGAGAVAWLALLLSFVSIGALAAAYWLWSQQDSLQQQNLQQWQTAQAEQMQQLELQLQTKVTEQQNALLAAQQGAGEQLKADVTQRLDAMGQQVAQLNGRQPQDWTLAEADYLIRIAGRKLWYEHDQDTALRMLSIASRQVALIGDDSLKPLRDAISADIAVIRGLPKPRVTDFHTNLGGWIQNVENMKINVVHRAQVREQQPAQEEAAASMTDNFVNSVTDSLKQMFYFDYNTTDTKLKHNFGAQEQWYLKANVKLSLLQAQNAVLQRNDIAFKSALAQAKQMLKQFYQADSQVQAVLVGIDIMLSESVAVQYPQKFQSQAMLKQLLSDRLGDSAPVLQDSLSPEQGAAQ